MAIVFVVMDWVLIFALWITGGADVPPNPTPPPTIVTIRVSPLCQAVRSDVAPIITGLMVQDHAITQTSVVMNDISRVQSMGGSTWVDFETVHLLNAVDIIAANNIKIHKLLDKLAALKLHDKGEAAQITALQKRLLAVADRQAAALNVYSGAADSLALANLTSGMVDAEKAANVSAHSMDVLTSASISSIGGDVVAAADVNQVAAIGAERYVTPALTPVIAHCL